MISGISPVLDGAPQRSGTQIPACSLQGNVQCTATARACRISRRAPPHFPQRRAELIDPTRCCLSWFGAGPLSPPAGGTSLAGAPASSPRVASPTCGVKETSTRRSTDLALATEIHRVLAFSSPRIKRRCALRWDHGSHDGQREHPRTERPRRRRRRRAARPGGGHLHHLIISSLLQLQGVLA
ncbi:hypothetical protein BDA96_09G132200 [Sorghum bicolor]|uniref:Uncharacterized protein n=1 Tax=Sorghum bicolor TaxID=4558 RepID=A0A921Q9H1_SORBI|nr:hypothetical protein BDA96_09G132200 [Sorghum bicolor]